MNDRELIELAAKAAGKGGMYEGNVFVLEDPDTYECSAWNPLTDDGDALRLAVKLHIGLGYQAPDYRPNWTTVASERGGARYASETGDDPYAATRRAIVRAAAEIGKGVA